MTKRVYYRGDTLGFLIATRFDMVAALSSPDPSAETRAFFNTISPDSPFLSGATREWEALAQSLRVDASLCAPLPCNDSLLREAAVQLHKPLLSALLLDVGVDPEGGSAHGGFSMWQWVASLVINDSISSSPEFCGLRDDCWEILIPLLMACGLSMDAPAMHSSSKPTRRRWLAAQSPDKFERALALADALVLDRSTSAKAFNNESKRL